MIKVIHIKWHNSNLSGIGRFCIMIILCFISSSLPMRGCSIDSVQVQNQQERHSDFSFPYQTYDFGKIKKKKSHTFEVTNTGDAPLVIIHIATGCGCTTVSSPEKPILPGKTGKIVVSFDPETQRAGLFRKSITIYTNSPKDYTRLFITGEIVK